MEKPTIVKTTRKKLLGGRSITEHGLTAHFYCEGEDRDGNRWSFYQDCDPRTLAAYGDPWGFKSLPAIERTAADQE